MLDVSQELLDIVDENNQPLNIIKSRIQVHQELSDWHRTTGIYIINLHKQFLCQMRSKKKDANPGAWSPHFGGHLTAGQTYLENAVVELKEELGISTEPENLIPMLIDKNYEFLHHCQFYLFFWNGKIEEVHLNDGEVEQVKWLSIEEFEKLKRQTGKPEFRMNQQIVEFVNKIEVKESAGGVVVSPDGNILVVKQKNNTWSLPKGGINQGESVTDAARREIFEESGISRLDLVKPLGRISRNGFTSKNERYTKTINLFLFKTDQIDLNPQDTDNPEAKWVGINEVSSILTHPKDKEFFERIKGEIPNE